MPRLALILGLLLLAGCDRSGSGPAYDAPVPATDVSGDWPLHGRTLDEQRHSPLNAIHRGNIDQLGVAWSYATGTKRGLEATPIVIDGVMYATGSWSVVFALDAATGKELWRFDPKVPKAKGRDACCDVVNRGVAVHEGRVFVGTIDGRLIALDAFSGNLMWETLTTDPEQAYTITAAPRVVKGKVIIGNGGAEFGVRGYFSAYDARTGELVWRFYTVPASYEGPHEHPELEMAARTWSKDSLWKSGLGGTVWDSMAYDPELDLLYVGTGNSSVYLRRYRSPGGGDNLFLASILAVHPDTGRLAWHYQTVPGEHFDYTATQQMVLADLEIEGRKRKVLMQAPKNGFFYVLDRETGEFLSAEKFVHVSWASHVDSKTGRPVEREEANWEEERKFISPAVFGAHSWHPMSFSPDTGLVYIPAIEMPYIFDPDPNFQFVHRAMNTAENYSALQADFQNFQLKIPNPCGATRLLAWDPVEQKLEWEVRHESLIPGGVLSTAGGLIFQGGGGGVFSAYDAETGARLWSSEVGIGIMAAPVTYSVRGEQYVAVLAGVGGAMGLNAEGHSYENEGRLIVWKLGGNETMPDVRAKPEGRVTVKRIEVSREVVARGAEAYARHCLRCHGIGARSMGLLPDLRFSKSEVHEQWTAIVLGGTRGAHGMASFADLVSEEQAREIQAFVISRAHHEPGVIENLAEFFSTRVCMPVSLITD
ncbi:MAG: PQQ-dependent dehydrogenase, methanol/ethanol family [bacterium]|nr:PQQ-dependent dehydrogenase, methanol/ethanol family [bacterium]